jgi:cytochrome P450 family 71 subfamily A
MEEVASMVAKICATATAGEDGGGERQCVNVSELLVGLSYTVISRAAFGNKLGGMSPGAVREMMKEFSELLQTIAVSDFFPRLWWVDWAMGLHSRIKKTSSKLHNVLEAALQEHEKSSGDEGDASDFVDDLIAMVGKGGDDLMLDRIDVEGFILVRHSNVIRIQERALVYTVY